MAASPAGALTGGFGVAEALQGVPLPVLSAGTVKRQQGHLASCHASELGVRGSAASAGLGEKLGKKVAPVACEQPPRSQLVSPDALKHAVAAALAVLG
ncbi:MAG TPA: hypothetical protein VH721_06740 [Gaiellaceae bacterium]